jgi:hypothetical protein
MTAPAVVYSGEGEGPARVALADALRARGITVLPMPNPRAARFLPTEPGAVLADAGLSAVLRRSGLRTAAVGPDESWLGHFEPNRLVLPLERG